MSTANLPQNPSSASSFARPYRAVHALLGFEVEDQTTAPLMKRFQKQLCPGLKHHEKMLVLKTAFHLGDDPLPTTGSHLFLSRYGPQRTAWSDRPASVRRDAERARDVTI